VGENWTLADSCDPVDAWAMPRVRPKPANRKAGKPEPVLVSPPEKRRTPLLIAIGLAIVTLLVYSTALTTGFNLMDDDWYVTQNVHVLAGLSWQNVAWAFTHQHVAMYHPLTTLTHMADVQFFGLNAMWQHLVNALLHVANSVLLFIAMRMLTRRTWPSAFVAAVFALHPQHVESVDWISERKDVLSGLFFMLCLIAYARYAKVPSLAKYLLVAGLFLLGLLSKPMLVTLPIILLLLDYWPLSRANPKRLILEKIPLGILSILFAIVAFVTQFKAGAVQEKLSLAARLANAVLSVVRYVGVFAWPSELSIVYPHPGHWPIALVVIATVALLLLTIVVILRACKQPALLVGLAWFFVMLLPVIGIIQIGLQAMGDRYSYVPSIGLSIAIVWLGLDLLPARPHRLAIGIGSGMILLLLAVLTFTQVQVWSTPETLLVSSMNNAGDDPQLHAILAHALWEAGRHDEAIAHLRETLKGWPNDDEIHWRLGYFLLQTGQLPEADEQLTKALRLQPRSPPALIYLAFVRKQQGRTGDAMQLLKQALEVNPSDPMARDMLKEFESQRK
jgi:hypothetical protein